jgi:hypothetical protein
MPEGKQSLRGHEASHYEKPKWILVALCFVALADSAHIECARASDHPSAPAYPIAQLMYPRASPTHVRPRQYSAHGILPGFELSETPAQQNRTVSMI